MGQQALTIVLVEDEDLVRNFISSMLQQDGFLVLRATNAEQALDICRKTPNINVVLSDIEMGFGMSGIELAKRLSDERPKIRVVLMSGAPGLERVAAASHFRFLLKPFSPATLVELLREALAAPENPNIGTSEPATAQRSLTVSKCSRH
jgi:DNA-binding NtrC family response regulator